MSAQQQQAEEAVRSARQQEVEDPDSPVVSDDEVDQAIEIVVRVIRRAQDTLPSPWSWMASGLVTLLEFFVKPQDTPIGHLP